MYIHFILKIKVSEGLKTISQQINTESRKNALFDGLVLRRRCTSCVSVLRALSVTSCFWSNFSLTHSVTHA